jgi:hypothetical protein
LNVPHRSPAHGRVDAILGNASTSPTGGSTPRSWRISQGSHPARPDRRLGAWCHGGAVLPVL